MRNNNELIKKLTHDVKNLENRIEHRKLYNIRNFAITALLKSGIAIDYARPFLLVVLIGVIIESATGNTSFYVDEKVEKASVETIDTSSGIHMERVSYDFDYDDELIEHSTGWYVNDEGLYERTITSYGLSDKINLEETEKIMDMTKEELEQVLTLTNVKTIKKSTLTHEDSIYNEDAIIVISNSESGKYSTTRLETTGENVMGTIICLLFGLWWGYLYNKAEKLFVKTYLRDRLIGYESFFKQINEA